MGGVPLALHGPLLLDSSSSTHTRISSPVKAAEYPRVADTELPVRGISAESAAAYSHAPAPAADIRGYAADWPRICRGIRGYGPADIQFLNRGYSASLLVLQYRRVWSPGLQCTCTHHFSSMSGFRRSSPFSLYTHRTAVPE